MRTGFSYGRRQWKVGVCVCVCVRARAVRAVWRGDDSWVFVRLCAVDSLFVCVREGCLKVWREGEGKMATGGLVRQYVVDCLLFVFVCVRAVWRGGERC